MRIKKYIFLLFSLSPCLLFSLSPYLLFSQSPHPENWDKIIAEPWYFGNIENKPAFLWIDSMNNTSAYFFVADKALPIVNEATIKWKHGDPVSVSFHWKNKKIKAKFLGTAGNDTIAGQLMTSRKAAIHLGVSPQLTIFMSKEQPCLPASMPPGSPASMPPCPPASRPPRYNSPLFTNVGVLEDVSYGAATGYYASMPVETREYDYQQIILDAMEKMYVNPTKEAIVHLLNKDPLSFAVTDLQALRMDIYQPAGDTRQDRPLILLLHGGAFILGDKSTESVLEMSNSFARIGYVVAAINYRMGFNPASKSSLERSAYRAVQDARAALRYLAANASLYRIDPDWVFLGGSSAGAITALNTAFMKEEERPESTHRNLLRAQIDLGGLDESTNNMIGDYTIRAVVNLWGAVNDTMLIDKNENIPVLSIHGDADRIVPYNVAYPFLDMDTSMTSYIVSKLYGSLPVHNRLQDLGIHSELITLHNAGHEPQSEPGKYMSIMDTVLTRTSDFYFRAMFNFPEVTGPRQIAMGTAPASYTIPESSDLSFYWQVTGGKLIPGSAKNNARISWLAEREGSISLVLVHKNGANVEIAIPVEIPQ
jgi:acetyl esterase/lipase